MHAGRSGQGGVLEAELRGCCLGLHCLRTELWLSMINVQYIVRLAHGLQQLQKCRNCPHQELLLPGLLLADGRAYSHEASQALHPLPFTCTNPLLSQMVTP